MRERLKKALLLGSLISIFCVVPVRGQTSDYYTEYSKVCEIATEAVTTVKKVKTEKTKLKNKAKPVTRYTKAQLNIRKKPNVESDIIGVLNYNQKIEVKKVNKNWAVILKNGKKSGYVNRKYLSKKEMDSNTYWIPEYSGMKSWMDFRKITSTTSPQYKLQHEYAYTGSYGIRMVDGRYCVAIGYAFDPHIGQYFDLVLENGAVIPCVISDEKSVYDTDSDNIFTLATDCCTEFVIDIDNLDKSSAKMGDISYCNETWDSPVEKIKIYEKNVLED